MPQARSHRLLVAAALLLAGLAAYEGFALAAVRSDSAFGFPGDVVVVGELAPPPTGLRAEDAPVVEVTVAITPRARLRERRQLPPCRVFVGDAEATAAEVQWIAGSSTWPLGSGPDLGDQQLVAIGLGGRRTVRLVTLRDPAEAVVRLGGEVSVGGFVTNGDGGAIVGARIWIGGDEVQTDDAGRFDASVMGGAGLPVAVRAAGFASTSLVLDAQAAVVDGLRFVLHPAADVRVRLLGPMVSEGGPAQVFVLPGGDPITSDEAQYPYFLQALEGGVPMTERGLALLRDLPLDARVRVVVDQPGLVAGAPPTAVTRARPLDLAVAVTATPRLAGRVLTEAGAPRADALVVSASHAFDPTARPPAASLALPPVAYRLSSGAVRTAADGSFSLARRHGAEAGLLLATAVDCVVVEMAVHADARALTLDLPLPAAPGPTAPRLELQAPAGRYDLRITEVGRAPRPVVRWSGGAPFVIPLREWVLADVSVRVDGADGPRTSTRQGVAILADVPLVLPR